MATVDDVVAQLSRDTATLVAIKNALREDLRHGADGRAEKSSLRMLNSFVDRLPSGSESGVSYALDLGGTNFRVLRVELDGGRVASARAERFELPASVLSGDQDDLFGFLADAIKTALERFGADTDVRAPLGFTFSFPCAQTAVNAGALLRWTKGFAVRGVEGEDVVQLLQGALSARGVRADVACLANDTVSTLVAHRVTDTSCVVGLILGTGSNAAYVERADRFHATRAAGACDRIVINTEWGGFGKFDGQLPRSDVDEELDRDSLYPGEQRFEKQISGMYLGELVFRAAARCGCAPPCARDAFTSKEMAAIESSSDPQALVSELFGSAVTAESARGLQRICVAVSTRAAQLAAVGVAAIVEEIDEEKMTVAVDGSIFKHYPAFESRMKAALKEVAPQAAPRTALVLREDGSGIGAAVTALVYSRAS